MSYPGSLPSVRSERLELRPVTDSDLPLLVELNSDARVMAYIRGRAATPSETESEWSERLTLRSDVTRGLGYWLGFEGHDFIGWWSASHVAGRPEVSGIGYRLRQSGWGRGLATEGAETMLEQAFSAPGIEGVFASTMAANTSSRHVLEKLGMTHTSSWVNEPVGTIPGSENGDVGYELSLADWRATTS